MTPRQKDVLDLVRARLEADGIAPSYEEIKDALGLANRGQVHALVTRLVERRHLVRDPRRPRSLALPTSGLSHVPTAKLVQELESRGWKRAA